MAVVATAVMVSGRHGVDSNALLCHHVDTDCNDDQQLFFTSLFHFYRAMHFSAKRGIAIACRLSDRLSVCPSICNVGEL